MRAASSGEAGIDAVREAMPDVVDMDVRMPGISGLEAYAAMREIEPRLPVIIMTPTAPGHGHRGHQDGGLRLHIKALRHPREPCA